ncbi:RagB/SusD family nutrient uptake outer membrane protein [Geofilum rubicundum]|uniref:TonB-dependent receptor n=1 Tax=Geofilum rubicundum JCM 15548 TaxID=1236989 RepID=A0A0E9M167_9BACT|nr:RagB/SusD family nutrient uptake outer membrane protein [Geofilum rubicundum]GAO30865.1 TonB-dependent receptor [Geofilum rubicundum JCM 15548]
MDGINNPGPYALQETFYDLHLGANDRNSEMMLYADHTEESEYYNAASFSWSNGAAPENFAAWFVTWNYTTIRSAKDAAWTDEVSSVQREAAQAYGRPWTRMAPTIGAITNTFADKTLDSRYDATFVTTFRGNWKKGGVTEEVLYNANGLPVSNGDAILTFLDEDNANVVYPTQTSSKELAGFDYSNVGGGTLSGRSDFVIEPSAISRLRYPTVWKLGTYRTDSGDGLGQPNGALTRPFYIAKFSEFYFIAAEAAVKGASVQAGSSARELINVIRARAGKWNWDNNGNVAREEDNSAAMMAATPVEITIDYVLAERSREYFAEGYRWFDLVRTQKWEELAGSYQIAGRERLDRQAQTINRTIEKYHYLRPIPSGQIDGLEMTEAEKAEYQNPGY